jgi:hypothetical protein
MTAEWLAVLFYNMVLTHKNGRYCGTQFGRFSTQEESQGAADILSCNPATGPEPVPRAGAAVDGAPCHHRVRNCDSDGASKITRTPAAFHQAARTALQEATKKLGKKLLTAATSERRQVNHVATAQQTQGRSTGDPLARTFLGLRAFPYSLKGKAPPGS